MDIREKTMSDGEEFEDLTGKTIPEDELKSALEFEYFNSKEQMMCGWQRVAQLR